VAEPLCSLSSVAVHVTITVPGDTPEVLSIAVLPLTVRLPTLLLNFNAIGPTPFTDAVTTEVAPATTMVGPAVQLTFGTACDDVTGIDTTGPHPVVNMERNANKAQLGEKHLHPERGDRTSDNPQRNFNSDKDPNFYSPNFRLRQWSKVIYPTEVSSLRRESYSGSRENQGLNDETNRKIP
jgi:hypothetical protein